MSWRKEEAPVKCRSVRGIPGKTVAREVAVDAGKDVLLMAAAFAVILLLGMMWPMAGSVGRWIFAFAAVVLTVLFLVSCLLGLADSVLDGMRGGDVEGSGWLILATVLRFGELALVYWMAVTLFQSFP
jgi:hypothetical protein